MMPTNFNLAPQWVPASDGSGRVILTHESPVFLNTQSAQSWATTPTATPWTELERLMAQMATGQIAIAPAGTSPLRLLDHYILDGHTPVLAASIPDWAQWLEADPAERVVQQTILANGYFVSTVFLGRDLHESDPPDLFETMVFTHLDGGDEVHTQRTATWDAAWDAHLAAVFAYQKEAPYVPPAAED